MGKTLFQRWFGSTASRKLRNETTEALAESGDAEAQFTLGLKYANGTGVTLDYPKAALWYLKAASQNHALAQFNLAMMHAHGQGMPQDEMKSRVWIQKAAELGDAGAQYTLGLAHQRAVSDRLGEDASQSRIEAFKWLQLAAVQGYARAEATCEVVNLHMSREEVLEGQRRVASFNCKNSNAPAGRTVSSVR